MELIFNREKYQKMVDYILKNVGGILALYTPPKGQLLKNHNGEFVKPIRATADIEEFKWFVVRYMSFYNCYPDYPILEYNEAFTLVYIKPSFETATAVPKGFGRGNFYDK